MKPTALLPLLFAACATAGPAWVKAKSGPHLDPDGSRVFLGTGMAQSVSNPRLAWEFAEERSRAELVASLTDFLAGLTRDYAASRPDADPAETRRIVEALKNLVTPAVFGGPHSSSSGRFIDSKGRYFSQWRLPLSGLEAELREDKGLDDGFRRFALARLEAAFDAKVR